MEIPEAFRDAVFSMEVMRDPVATVDGQTYERSAIEHWLRDHNTSPLTGEVLAMKMLIPNHTVRGLSRKWLEEHPECEDGDDDGGPLPSAPPSPPTNEQLACLQPFTIPVIICSI